MTRCCGHLLGITVNFLITCKTAVMMKPVMKLVFVLDAFCLVLVSAFPLVKDPSEISCTSDFSCGKFVSALVLTYMFIQPSTANSSFDVTNLTLTFDPDPLEKGKNVTITGTGIISKLTTEDTQALTVGRSVTAV